mmetsp:Transcript_2872/g.8139  ORF Transcript_2872/g.8139 Transcript_2872/m.8139 type:complete len:560 (-) Transcript_2872:45-1724(-)
MLLPCLLTCMLALGLMGTAAGLGVAQARKLPRLPIGQRMKMVNIRGSLGQALHPASPLAQAAEAARVQVEARYASTFGAVLQAAQGYNAFEARLSQRKASVADSYVQAVEARAEALLKARADAQEALWDLSAEGSPSDAEDSLIKSLLAASPTADEGDVAERTSALRKVLQGAEDELQNRTGQRSPEQVTSKKDVQEQQVQLLYTTLALGKALPMSIQIATLHSLELQNFSYARHLLKVHSADEALVWQLEALLPAALVEKLRPALWDKAAWPLTGKQAAVSSSGTSDVELRPITSDFGCKLPSTMAVRGGNLGAYMLQKLRRQEAFNFVRFGDGEWMCVDGQTFQNCDNLHGYPEMCTELVRYTKDPALRSNVDMMFGHHTCLFVEQIEHYPRLGTWYPVFGFMDFLRPEKGQVLADMMAAVRSRGPVVVVGPAYLNRLHAALGHAGYVKVPNAKFCNDIGDAWTAHENIENGVLAASGRFPDHSVQFLAAGGMAMKVIIMKMASVLPKDSFFDIGSTFDGFAGVQSRDYNGASLKADLSGGPLMGWFSEHDVEGVGC